VVLAIVLALALVLKKIYQPQDAILGVVTGLDGYNDITHYPYAKTIPGIIIYRFEGPLLFFNADLFKSRIRELVENAMPLPNFIILSLEAVSQLDVTGIEALYEAHDELKSKGVQLLLARPKRYMREYAQSTHAEERLGMENIFPSIRAAVESALAREQAGQADQPEKSADKGP
jgi:MFS superfamily sulfate permease-like transporter